jgi:S-adenosylhomocysteine hydrolase
LNDIIELNKVFSSLFEKLVYVVVPYSTETKILPSRSYSTYYHEIENNIYFVKKDVDIITDTNDFYSAMYESIKAAFKHDVIPLVCQGKKVIIIEDGGFHYNIINELIHTYPVLETAIIGVIEQTTSGVRRYKDFVNSINIPYPVLSVARSKIKMRLESHFIARRVIDELNYLLYMANNFLSFHKVLIIGYGIIGRNISSALSALKCNIEVYDIEDGILSIAKDDGINVIDSIQNIQFTDNLIIIGATGEAAFTSLMFFSFVTSDAKKIYLASASSKRIEFQNIVNFFEVGDKDEAYRQIIDEMKNILIEQKDYGTIYNFRYKDVDKKIVLIANGYPVNFFRKNIISLTESVIDLINCEIFILIEYLLKEKENLKPQLYLLGSSDLHSLDVEEECLVQSWVNLLALQFDETDGTIWKRFDVHPFEDSLRNNCLPTTEKGAKK